MHGFHYRGYEFSFNSDLSGNVQIFNTAHNQHMSVPGDALLAFIANYVVSARISKLEDASPKELLGL